LGFEETGRKLHVDSAFLRINLFYELVDKGDVDEFSTNEADLQEILEAIG
jgi:hypothetical protein